MAYDEELANRIREVLADEDGVTEQRMFGGLAFMIAGHMAVSASGRGGLLLRCDPERDRRAGAEAARRALRDARPGDGRLAAHRAGGRPHQARPSALGLTRCGVCEVAAAEGVSLRPPSSTTPNP